MLTVKFMKHAPEHEQQPTHTEAVCVRGAKSVHVRYEAYHDPSDTPPRAVVQCGDAPGETYEATVGPKNCSFSVAYIMNEAGRTVETIR